MAGAAGQADPHRGSDAGARGAQRDLPVAVEEEGMCRREQLRLGDAERREHAPQRLFGLGRLDEEAHVADDGFETAHRPQGLEGRRPRPPHREGVLEALLDSEAVRQRAVVAVAADRGEPARQVRRLAGVIRRGDVTRGEREVAAGGNGGRPQVGHRGLQIGQAGTHEVREVIWQLRDLVVEPLAALAFAEPGGVCDRLGDAWQRQQRVSEVLLLERGAPRRRVERGECRGEAPPRAAVGRRVPPRLDRRQLLQALRQRVQAVVSTREDQGGYPLGGASAAGAGWPTASLVAVAPPAAIQPLRPPVSTLTRAPRAARRAATSSAVTSSGSES